MVNSNRTVCFFDSGIGGLGLLHECVRKLPRVDFVYFADNFRVPYGNIEREEMLKLVDAKFSQMEELKPSAAVIACNTVTAQCVEYLRKKYSFDIIGIQPAVKPAAAAGGTCLVLATPSTAKSESLKSLIEKYGEGRTRVAACPDLAAYIENNVGILDVKEVKKRLPEIKADNVVLGCTHYGFVKDIIKNFYNCPVFDGIEGTAEQLCKKLGICDHSVSRAQKISFCGGDYIKNRNIFNLLLRKSGNNSQNL